MIRRFSLLSDDFWDGFYAPTWTLKTVDTDKFDIINGELVPRQSYKDEQIKQIKEKIRVLEKEKAKLEKQ